MRAHTGGPAREAELGLPLRHKRQCLSNRFPGTRPETSYDLAWNCTGSSGGNLLASWRDGRFSPGVLSSGLLVKTCCGGFKRVDCLLCCQPDGSEPVWPDGHQQLVVCLDKAEQAQLGPKVFLERIDWAVRRGRERRLLRDGKVEIKERRGAPRQGSWVCVRMSR